jgi:hypothetical protein
MFSNYNVSDGETSVIGVTTRCDLSLPRSRYYGYEAGIGHCEEVTSYRQFLTVAKLDSQDIADELTRALHLGDSK